MKRRSSLLVAITSVVVCMLVVGIATVGAQVTKPTKNWTIVNVNSINGIPYFARAEEGVKQFAKDFGINAYMTGPTEYDAMQQVKLITDLLSKKIDALIPVVLDPNALYPVIKQAVDRGVLLVAWGNPGTSQLEQLSKLTIQNLDDVALGQHAIDRLVHFMGNTGDYAVLDSNLSEPTHTMWWKSGFDYARQKYPNLHQVTDRIATDDKIDVAYQKTLELIKTYPNLKGIVCLSSGVPMGAAQAVREKGLINKISVVGFGMPKQCAEFLKDGSLKESQLWDPWITSYVACYLTWQLLEKQRIFDGMEVPKVGKIQIKGKIVIPSLGIDFTKDNVDQYPF